MALPARSFTKEEGQELEMGITAMLADVKDDFRANY